MPFRVRLKKIFHFEAAHRLEMLPPEHQCSRLHGHSYQVTLEMVGEVDDQMGWFIDAGEIKRIFSPLLKQLDHHFLNEIPGLEVSTAENIARWIYEKTKPLLKELDAVELQETKSMSVRYPA